MVVQYSKTTPHRVTFWFKPVSTFGLLKITTFIGSSHTLVVPAHPLLLSAFVPADSALPRGRRTEYPVATLSPELHTELLPARYVRVGNG